jgi:hypothetical protein
LASSQSLLADLVRNATWAAFVCVGLAVGTTLSKIRIPAMGFFGFLAAPLAFGVSRSVRPQGDPRGARPRRRRGCGGLAGAARPHKGHRVRVPRAPGRLDRDPRLGRRLRPRPVGSHPAPCRRADGGPRLPGTQGASLSHRLLPRALLRRRARQQDAVAPSPGRYL